MTPLVCTLETDLSLRRVWEGISFPNFFGEVHPETAPLQALCSALCSTEQRGRKGWKGAEKRGGRGVASKGSKKEKGRAKTGKEKHTDKGWRETFWKKAKISFPSSQVRRHHAGDAEASPPLGLQAILDLSCYMRRKKKELGNRRGILFRECCFSEKSSCP